MKPQRGHLWNIGESRLEPIMSHVWVVDMGNKEKRLLRRRARHQLDSADKQLMKDGE